MRPPTLAAAGTILLVLVLLALGVSQATQRMLGGASSPAVHAVTQPAPRTALTPVDVEGAWP